MKRSKKIVANGYSARVTVTIKIDTRSGHLVRDEIEAMTESLASNAMRMLEGTRYLNVPLSQIKVI